MKIPKNYWTTGEESSLHEILNHREKRALMQQLLLEKLQQNIPSVSHSLGCTLSPYEEYALISLSLNIAGPVKSTPLTERTFAQAIEEITFSLEAHSRLLINQEELREAPGSTVFFLVKAPPIEIKKQMILLEEASPLGRLYDIDVLDISGRKLSREWLGAPSRRCLLCKNPVFLCSRSRTHPLETLVQEQNRLMWNHYTTKQAAKIGACFAKAMIYEVTTTPKPGLVDRCHQGAHKDMDIDLFMDSIYALESYYTQCALESMQNTALSPRQLFEQTLRPMGVSAEQRMLAATKGVNTHKGLIFSGGVFCSAAGYVLAHESSMNLSLFQKYLGEMLAHLTDDFHSLRSRPPKTNGEELYLKYGITGIRGEAAKGFPLVMESYTRFLQLKKEIPGIYRRGRAILLHLLAHTQDSNIIHRSDYATYQKIRGGLHKFLEHHPPGTFDERPIIEELDRVFIEKNISPGGCADLLALVYFLHFLCRKGF